MKVTVGKYTADMSKGIDISIPVTFDKKQLSAFGGGPALKKAYKAGKFIGDVGKGGSCNCAVYTFSPHLNGTHTECIGHLTKQKIAVHEVLKESLIPATVITVKPGRDGQIAKFPLGNKEFLGALVVRTLPNGKDKKIRNYKSAPYFSLDAMWHIAKSGVRHLLVDFPSVDKMDDGGALMNHRIFWDKKNSDKTITELVYVPNSVKDGSYLLNLQVSAFDGDAAPSRPVLYKVKK
jgi:arylformamidase